MLNDFSIMGAVVLIFTAALIYTKRNKKIESSLYELKDIKLLGIKFKLQKMNVFNYMTGAAILKKEYDKYALGNAKDPEINKAYEKKLRAHYRDVILSGVVVPYITRKKEDVGVWVEDVLNNWQLADALYNEVIDFTYGKKKAIQTFLAKTSL